MIIDLKPKKYGYLKFLGYLLAIPGILFVGVGIAGFFETASDKNDQILGGLLFGSVALFFGIILILNAVKKEKDSKKRYVESVIYSLAKENNGVLNAIEVSIVTLFPEIECEQVLNSFITKGHAIPEVNEKGFVEYKFPVYLKE